MLHGYPDYLLHAPVSVHQPTGHQDIDKVVIDFADVFNKEQRLGYCDILPFTIDTGTVKPVRQQAYRLPLPKQRIVEEQLQDMLTTGVIQPSTFPSAYPITLQPKKDGPQHFCVDYRWLNAVTTKDSYLC